MGLRNWLYYDVMRAEHTEEVKEAIEPFALSSDANIVTEAFQSGQGSDPDEALWSPLSSATGLTRRKNLSSLAQDQMLRLVYQFYK